MLEFHFARAPGHTNNVDDPNKSGRVKEFTPGVQKHMENIMKLSNYVFNKIIKKSCKDFFFLETPTKHNENEANHPMQGLTLTGSRAPQAGLTLAIAYVRALESPRLA